MQRRCLPNGLDDFVGSIVVFILVRRETSANYHNVTANRNVRVRGGGNHNMNGEKSLQKWAVTEQDYTGVHSYASRYYSQAKWEALNRKWLHDYKRRARFSQLWHTEACCNVWSPTQTRLVILGNEMIFYSQSQLNLGKWTFPRTGHQLIARHIY